MSAAQSFESLPNGTILTDGDNTVSRDLKSRQKDLQIQRKLEKITEQLAEVRTKRLTMKRFDDGRIRGPPKDYTTVPKKPFSHPNLGYVFGEIMYSPYLTNPKDSYPRATYTMAETLKEFKQKGLAFKDIPESERPYNEKELKRQFIREVCNYNPKFNIPKMIKKNATEGSITSASTSKRVGTASSTHGRSTANSTVASSVTSLKDDRGNSTSMRKRQLNAVKPRKHASAMSMSLDSSGFVASVSRKNDSVKSNDCAAVPATVTDVNVDVTSQKAREAVQDDEDAASQKAGEVVAQDEGYNDDFEQPPAETTVTASNDIGEGDGGYYEEVFEGNEEEKEEEVVVDALVVQKPAQEEEDEDVYDADFEHTGALPASDVTAPSPVQPSAPSPTLIPAAVSPPSATSEAVAEVVVKPSFSAETETVEAAEDIYENDFEQNATEISSAAEAEVEPAAAAATTTGDVPDDTAYGDDFEDADGKNAAAPVAAESVPAAVPEESSSTKTDTDKFLDSVKLRTDLLGASNNTAATARSVLSSEGIITDIRDEQATTSAVHTAPDSPVPSTVRSELDSHAVAPLESAPHSHTNSVRSADLEAETTDQRTAAVVEVQQPKPASSSEQGDGVDTENLLSKARQDAKVGEADSGRQHLPVREEPEYSHFLGNSDKLDASVEQVFSDDPIDEILYVEGKVGSDKAGDAISNNFLNSPQRGGISKNTFEEMPGSVVSSPGGPQINNPDEEIGEEIE